MRKSLVKWIGVLLVVAGGVSVNGQEVVMCGNDTSCSTLSIGRVSPFECCVTFENGLTYTVPGVEGCFVCIVFGFNTTEFIAVESEDNYAVEIRVIKGLTEFIFPPVYRVQMKSDVGNVDSGDVLFEPKDITLNTNDPILIPFKFILDGVEREQNETFTLEMVYVSGTQPRDAFFTQEIEMVIIDGDISNVTIMLENDTYEVDEGVGKVEICAILVNDIATSVSFNVVIPPARGNAEEGLDFNGIPEPSLLSFVPNGPRRLCTKVVIIDDEIIESTDPENLFVEISGDNIILQARILITDNEVITVGFDIPSVTAEENSIPIQTQGPTPDSNTMVECRTDHSCGGSSVISTMRDCCDHDIEPSGLAYTIPGNQACHLCPVDFGFNQSTFSGIEQGENYRIPIKFFSGGAQQGFFINVYLNLSGTAGINDIILMTTRLRFLPGTIQQNIEFWLSVDNIAQELDETFVITLEVVPDGTFGPGATIRNRLEGVIIDSDEIEFQLSEEDYTQSEEPNALLEVLITKGSGVTLANPVYFRVTPMTVDDAIRMGVIGEFEDENPFSPNRANYEDFDSTTLFTTFSIGYTVLSRELRIPIVDDNIDEAIEQVFIIFLEVVNATNFNKVNVNRIISIGRIKDDETTQIGFDYQSYEVTEPNPDDENVISNLVYLIREDNRTSEQTYSVDLTVGDPGGNTKPATIETHNTNQSFDYSFGVVGQTRRNIIFPPTVDRIAFVFSLNPDLAVEGTETFRATSAQRTPSGDFPVFQTPGGVTAFATTLIHILDNDELKVGFEEQNYTVSESAGTVEVCVIVISPPPTADLDITVTLSPSTIDGTAGAGSDFTQLTAFLSISLVFPSSPGSPTAGPRRECFDVTITNDDLVENTESFSLLLQEDRYGPQTGATIHPDRTDIFILDDDEMVIGFLNERYSVGESAGTLSIRFGVIKRRLVTDISVQLSFSDGSALFGSDYNSSERVYSLTGRESVTVNIGIIGDGKLEQAEVFYASLSFVNVPPNVTITPHRTEIVISDDDRARFGFDPVHYRVNEGAGSVTLFVVLFEGVLEREVNLQFSTVEGTAMASDYGTDTRTITFSSSVSNVSVSVTIYNDDILESTEHFLGNLTDPHSQTGVSIMPNTANVDIIDNYEVTIGFEQTTYSVNEGNVVEVCAVLTGTLNRSLEVFVNSSSGSATVAEDYNPVHETLTFGPTSNRTCFNFTTLGDEIHEEGMEDLNLHLSTMALNVTLDPFLAHIHILDHERAIGHTIPTVNNTTSNNWFNIFAIACAVVLLVVAMMIIVIVMIVALRCHHSALDLQKNNRSEPLPAISITGEAAEKDLDSHVYDDIYKYNKTNSQPAATHPPTLPPMPASITGEAVEKDLDSHVYDDIYKHNKSNSQPTATHTPTLPPMTASRNGEYKLTTCPAYASIDLKNIPTSRNGEYELTTCPAYAPTNMQSIPSKETKDRYCEIMVDIKPTIPPQVPACRNVGYEITTYPVYAPRYV